MKKKKLILLGASILGLVLLLIVINNFRRDKLIEREASKIRIGMTREELIKAYGVAHIIITSKDFGYIPENIEKHYYNREINLYPSKKNDVIVQIIISIDKNTNKVSEIIIDTD